MRLNDIPDDIDIQAEILVGNDVPQTGHLAPGDFGMLISEAPRHLPLRLANDLQTVNDCQKGSSIILEFIR